MPPKDDIIKRGPAGSAAAQKDKQTANKKASAKDTKKTSARVAAERGRSRAARV